MNMLIGTAVSTENACHVAWTTLFPDQTVPLLVSIMGGIGTGFQPHFKVTKTASSACTANTLTDASEFTNGAYTGKNYVCAIESATLGAGQVKKVISNTGSILTVEPWDITPTGTVVYQLCSSPDFALWEFYLNYAILTYLYQDTAAVNSTFQQLLDKLNGIPGGEIKPQTNMTLLKMYADRGKAIWDADNLSVV
jgi:hypothetical protein